jgi:hypothetical protein
MFCRLALIKKYQKYESDEYEKGSRNETWQEVYSQKRISKKDEFQIGLVDIILGEQHGIQEKQDNCQS